MVALDTNPNYTDNYPAFEYAFYHHWTGSAFQWVIYESGSGITSGTWSGSETYSIKYDGQYVIYYTGSLEVRRTYVGPGKMFAFQVACADLCSLRNLAFGPGGGDGLNGGSFTPVMSSGMIRTPTGGFKRTAAYTGGSWDQQFYSKEMIRNARVSFRPVDNVYACMVGLNGNVPTADYASDPSYASLDYAFYLTGSTALQIYESGNGRGTVASYDPTSVLSIENRDDLVFYLKDTSVVYVSLLPTTNLMGIDSSFVNQFAEVADVVFGTAPPAPDLFEFGLATLTRTGNNWQKTGGVNNTWDSAFCSSKGYSGAQLAVTVVGTSTHIFLGLDNHRSTAKDYTDSTFAIYFQAGSIGFWYNGTSEAAGPAYSVSDVWEIRHQGTKIHVLQNGIFIYTFATSVLASDKFWAHSAFYEASSSLNNVAWSVGGQDGSRQVTKFIRSASPPSTPTGANPSGWTDGIPSGINPLYAVRGTINYAGALVGVWSTPQLQANQVTPTSWASGTTYYQYQRVFYNGGTYSLSVSSDTGHAPSGDANANTWWDVAAAPGPPGTPASPPSGYTHTFTLTSATGLFNIRTASDAAGYPGGAATITVNVNSGITQQGSAGASDGGNGGNAIDTGTWPSGITPSITINVNSGGIVRAGGGGGGAGNSGSGGAGGDAIYCRCPITVVNAGAIQGGGYGGIGGNSGQDKFGNMLGGGGGGGGFPNGGSGSGGAGDLGSGAAGSAGTTGGGGAGGAGQTGTMGGGSFPSGAGNSGGGAGANGFSIRHNGNTVTYSGGGTLSGSNS